MNQCKYCGVELESKMKYCPLCGLAVGEVPDVKKTTKDKSASRDKVIYQITTLSDIQKRKLFWEIAFIILVSGIIATLIINFVISKDIHWAKYNLVISISVLASISSFTFLKHRPVLLILGSFFSSAILLMFLDVMSGHLGWGTKVGLPILSSLYILIIIVLLLLRLSKHRGFNVLAVVFIAIGLFLICIDTFVTLYTRQAAEPRWSFIAGSCILPIATILLFVHFRLKKGIDLKRFFHI